MCPSCAIEAPGKAGSVFHALICDGKLDYSKLASRFDQVIEEYQAESEEENAVAASNFDMERFYSSSIKAYNHLIRTDQSGDSSLIDC